MLLGRTQKSKLLLRCHKQMTSDDLCPAGNTRMYNVYETESRFLLHEWSVFAIISYLDVSCTFFTFTLLDYFAQKTPKRGVFWIFFICMPMSEERPVRFFIAKHLSLHGREVKVTVFLLDHVIWLWFWVDRRQAMFNRKFNTSIIWTNRSTIHLKLKSNLGVQCRKTLGSTARPRRQTLFA